VNDGWVNGGFMVFERQAFDGLPARDDLVLETDVLEAQAKSGDLAVYQHGGFWQSMDTYREMCLLNDMWTSGRAAWRIWDQCLLSA
jgi:glucose-1-phosphate cytidylyltransferase